jgi:hypothetical protein
LLASLSLPLRRLRVLMERLDLEVRDAAVTLAAVDVDVAVEVATPVV